MSCEDCNAPLYWSGRGRRPKRCKECAKAANRAKTRQRMARDRAHRKGQAASRWGDLWLVDGKAIRREARYVWGATGERDEYVISGGGVFRPAGRDGLPDMGVSTSHADLQSRLDRTADRARRDRWIKDNPDWWRIEKYAHQYFGKDVTDSVVVHGGSLVDRPDEHTPGERCTWCGDKKPLILAGEFCGHACMVDYVTTFGAQGLTLGEAV